MALAQADHVSIVLHSLEHGFVTRSVVLEESLPFDSVVRLGRFVAFIIAVDSLFRVATLSVSSQRVLDDHLSISD